TRPAPTDRRLLSLRIPQIVTSESDSDAPIVPGFIVRQGRGARHVVYLLPIIYPEHSGDLQADVVRTTEQLSVIFEDMVRRHPEQWLWVHKRWKTRPPGEPKIY